MATRIKIKRGTRNSIITNKATLEENEIVYSTDTGMLGIKSNGIETPDGIVWFLPKETYNIELGGGAVNGEYDSVAIGNDSFVGAEEVVAMGFQASVGVSAHNSIAIGSNAKILAGSNNENGIAIGYNAQVQSNGGIALGLNSVVASNPYSIVIGRGSSSESGTASDEGSVVIGGNSHSGMDGKNIIIGSSSGTSESGNIVIGNDSTADYDSLIIGHDNEVTSFPDSIVIGHGAATGAKANHVQLGKSSFTSGNIGNYPINLVGKMSGSGTMETTTHAEYRIFRLSQLNLTSLPINTKVLLWIFPNGWGTTREVFTTNVDGSIAGSDIKYTIFSGNFNTGSNHMGKMPLTILIEKLTSTTASVDLINMPMGLTTTSLNNDPNINISTGNIQFRASGVTTGNIIKYKWIVL